MKLCKGITCCIIAILLWSCKHEKPVMFTLQSPDVTGIDFKNTLVENETSNVLNYAYFYNGGGVSIGDINNDGLPDILFTGNVTANRLYLNKGNFRFEDITRQSGIAAQQGWCTGASMVDINGDGKLDIYICRSADIDPVRRRNLLFINQGNLHFTEESMKYGLADEGYSTQAVFFDYDKDGDLDMFLVNHSLQQYANGDYENTGLLRMKKPELANKLYRNEGGHFKNVSSESGIQSNVFNFGLGVSVSDFNNDGWPDIYVSNDFNEPDYLYMNNGNGSFTESAKKCLDQVSLYSMGCDAADFNNDGLIDLITLDMLPEDNRSQKMHTGAENFDKFQHLFQQGVFPQYSRNMLHRNNGDGTFSEIAQMAGVSNTDWSWSALFADFDNDGNKDLFISNGYEKDNTNMDFMKYRIDQMLKAKSNPDHKTIIQNLIAKMPTMKLSNYIFRNNGNSTFSNNTEEWGFGLQTASSGAAYADLNNDGALDLVISNINEEAHVYKNNLNELQPANHFLKVQLEGIGQNTGGIGSKVWVHCGKDMFYQEEMPVRGYQSSVDEILNFGLGTHGTVDSVMVEWPDGTMNRFTSIKTNQTFVAKQIAQPSDNLKQSTRLINKLFSETSAVPFIHRENAFNDFSVQPLMPSYLPRMGPCMAKADVNGNGLEDIYVGGAKGQAGQIFIQATDGNLKAFSQPAMAADSMCEDVAAAFFDANGDGYPDLYVASGGYDSESDSLLLQDRLYLNDGKGHFVKSEKKLPPLLFSKSCVRSADIDGDGDADIFVGGRVRMGQYPLTPPSKILINDGHGRFSDQTSEVAHALDSIGMVTDAAWVDLNKDGFPDLIIVGEWMPVKLFMNEKGKLVDRSADYIHFPSFGWWNCILVQDFDGDGKQDLILGNQGLNNQFKVNEKEPLTLYSKDFDDNGIRDMVMCYYIEGKSYPIYSRDDLTDHIPMLKKKFITYESYANATMQDVFTEQQLQGSIILKSEMMQTVYLHNTGHGFEQRQLPAEVQIAPVYAMVSTDLNQDGYPDLILGGNNKWSRIKFGRYEANHGTVLINDGKGNFTTLAHSETGLNFRGDVRSLKFLQRNNKTTELFVGTNDDSLSTYILNKNSLMSIP